MDHPNIQLRTQEKNFMEGTDLPQVIHKGAAIQLCVQEIEFKVHWKDQNFGVKKARLYLRLFRKDKMIVSQDVFGVFQRLDQNVQSLQN